MKKILSLHHVNAWYGDSQILHNVNLDMNQGEVLCLVGRNGVGKSTTLKAIMGLDVRVQGEILFENKPLQDLRIVDRVERGISYCPDDRGIFSNLSVYENLAIADAELDKAYSLFPVLKEKGHLMGSHLSGGEQQMLAIARMLKKNIKGLLLDEPTEGLAPVIVEKILAAISQLKKEGYSILLVEQNFQFCQGLADSFVIMDEGQVVDCFKGTKMISEEKLYKILGIKE